MWDNERQEVAVSPVLETFSFTLQSAKRRLINPSLSSTHPTPLALKTPLFPEWEEKVFFSFSLSNPHYAVSHSKSFLPPSKIKDRFDVFPLRNCFSPPQ